MFGTVSLSIDQSQIPVSEVMSQKDFSLASFLGGGSPILQPKILNDKAGNVAKVKLGFEKYHESARNCEVAFCFWESRFQRPVFFERTCY